MNFGSRGNSSFKLVHMGPQVARVMGCGLYQGHWFHSGISDHISVTGITPEMSVRAR